MTEETTRLADMMVAANMKCRFLNHGGAPPELIASLTKEFENRKEELIQAIIEERTPKLKAFLLPKTEPAP